VNDIGLLDLLEDGGILSNTHTQKLFCSPVLIENVVGVFSQLFHVGANEHLSELHKIAVVLVVHLNDTPRIRTSADLTTVGGDYDLIGTDDSKRDLAGNFLRLREGLLILIVISRGLEGVDVVVSNIRKDLRSMDTSMTHGRIED
jgi:hypothetical protein